MLHIRTLLHKDACVNDARLWRNRHPPSRLVLIRNYHHYLCRYFLVYVCIIQKNNVSNNFATLFLLQATKNVDISISIYLRDVNQIILTQQLKTFRKCAGLEYNIRLQS